MGGRDGTFEVPSSTSSSFLKWDQNRPPSSTSSSSSSRPYPDYIFRRGKATERGGGGERLNFFQTFVSLLLLFLLPRPVLRRPETEGRACHVGAARAGIYIHTRKGRPFSCSASGSPASPLHPHLLSSQKTFGPGSTF